MNVLVQYLRICGKELGLSQKPSEKEDAYCRRVKNNLGPKLIAKIGLAILSITQWYDQAMCPGKTDSMEDQDRRLQSLVNVSGSLASLPKGVYNRQILIVNVAFQHLADKLWRLYIGDVALCSDTFLSENSVRQMLYQIAATGGTDNAEFWFENIMKWNNRQSTAAEIQSIENGSAHYAEIMRESTVLI